ncbi:hypothetical protein AAU57_04030 [Nonlabens sp. YIK11]|uniref:DUF1800 domain-containing protein n=1 Tax=Nonlabens sp. YIK11 TaxID=1453349 RepID=UPI0006DC82A2|nr:DUF1800 domain-containing protein [Nonlabens sp. YIK11]KQC34503.1 hypothetical protein AAU57_04030 [Nonlabens sp. YIK11]
MNKQAIWSLRLGFSTAQQDLISDLGFAGYLAKSFAYNDPMDIPEFLEGQPMDFQSIRSRRRELNQLSPEQKAEARREQRQNLRSISLDWIQRMQGAQFPLRENMVCFWHNHYVATYQKVKVAPWIFEHYTALYEQAFGNFRELTKTMVKSNAVISYLDNDKNRKGSNNENLSRELLELFTLGIGNYTEADVKSGAKALAGLTYGNQKGNYRNRQRENEEITYLGKTGFFDSDAIVDIIFEQEAIPYLITEKILQWFVYDNPSTALIKEYGDYFREQDFEIQPLLEKIFLTEYDKNPIASKVKDPLRFALQTIQELHLEDRIEPKQIVTFLRDQSMDLYNQPNVKGWEGGNSWITSSILLRRNQVARMLISGERISKRNVMNRSTDPELPDLQIPKELENNKQIIAYLLDQTLTITTPTIQADLEEILKYDFQPHKEGSELGILRAYEYIITTPEYQVI